MVNKSAFGPIHVMCSISNKDMYITYNMKKITADIYLREKKTEVLARKEHGRFV